MYSAVRKDTIQINYQHKREELTNLVTFVTPEIVVGTRPLFTERDSSAANHKKQSAAAVAKTSAIPRDGGGRSEISMPHKPARDISVP